MNTIVVFPIPQFAFVVDPPVRNSNENNMINILYFQRFGITNIYADTQKDIPIVCPLDNFQTKIENNYVVFV